MNSEERCFFVLLFKTIGRLFITQGHVGQPVGLVTEGFQAGIGRMPGYWLALCAMILENSSPICAVYLPNSTGGFWVCVEFFSVIPLQ
jgi:hypothetical protein